MTILFDARRPVKSARNFGLGLVEPSPAPAHVRMTGDELAAVDARIALVKAMGDDWRARFGDPEPAPAPRAFEPSPGDRAWWAAESDRLTAARVNRRVDRRAAESAALDSLTLGLIPRDLAAVIARTSLVGHDA